MDWCRGRAYSQDLRLRVLAASDQGLSARAVAVQFAVSVSYVVKARQRRDRTGEARALTPRQTQVRRLAGHGEALRGRVAEKSDTTLAELCAWLHKQHGVSVGMTALWRELARLGLTLKKSRSMRPSRTVRTLLLPVPPGATRSSA